MVSLMDQKIMLSSDRYFFHSPDFSFESTVLFCDATLSRYDTGYSWDLENH